MALDLLAPLAPIKPATLDADDVQFARHDPRLCAMPGLFRFVDATERAATRTALRITHTYAPCDRYPEGLTMEAHNSSLLNGIDLAVLQALIGLAALSGDTLDAADAKTGNEAEVVAEADEANQAGPTLLPHEQQLLDGLIAPPTQPDSAQSWADPVTTSLAGDVRRIDFSGSQLLSIIGLPACGENRKLIADAVMRLATVTLIVYPTDNRRAMERHHLLASVKTNAQSTKWARTHVALNPRLTAIVTGATRHHARIELTETRNFGNDQIARILHQRICGWLNDGWIKPVTFQTLLEYVWPADPETAQVDALRRLKDKKFEKMRPAQIQHDRLTQIIVALNKIGTLPGWEFVRGSALPQPPYDEDKSLAENEQIQLEHNAQVTAAARKERADVMGTVVHIRRAHLQKLSNKTKPKRVKSPENGDTTPALSDDAA